MSRLLVTESVKHVNFVTRELPTDQSLEGLVVARLIQSLPSDWRVKVFVIRSPLLSNPIVPALPEVEMIVISEPQYKWDSFLLKALRYPLEKLATSESLSISRRILTDTSESDYIFVFSTSPVLNFVSRQFEAAHSHKGQSQELRVPSEYEGGIELKVFTNQSGSIPKPQWESLFDNTNEKRLSREAFMTEVSRVFGFSASLNRKHQFTSDVTIEINDLGSRNKLARWDISSQNITKSEIFVLSSKLASIIRPIIVVRKIAQFITQNLMKGLNLVFKIGYAVLIFLFNALGVFRKAICRKRKVISTLSN
jgi:hypothetical protein